MTNKLVFDTVGFYDLIIFMMKDASRLIEFDLLRIIAILGVIIVHIGASIVVAYPQNSPEFMVGVFFDALPRFSIQFFIIISGYFFLNGERDLPLVKIKNKILKLLFLLVFWSSIYALIHKPGNFLTAFLHGNYHIWYLYVITGLYMLVPVLRLFVKKENEHYIYYLIFLGIIFVFLPNFLDLTLFPNFAADFFNKFMIFQNIGYIVYFLLGWVFLNNKDKIQKYFPIFILLSIVCFMFIFLGSGFIFLRHSAAFEILYDPLALPAFIYSIAMFCTFYIIAGKIVPFFSDKIKTFICKISSLIFGVYLLHAVFLDFYVKYFLWISNKILYVAVCDTAVVVTSFLTAYLLSKIKYINLLIKI